MRWSSKETLEKERSCRAWNENHDGEEDAGNEARREAWRRVVTRVSESKRNKRRLQKVMLRYSSFVDDTQDEYMERIPIHSAFQRRHI